MEIEGVRKSKMRRRKEECERKKTDKERRPEAQRAQEESTLRLADCERKRRSKQKRMEELEVAALYSLTLMGTHTDLDKIALNH